VYLLTCWCRDLVFTAAKCVRLYHTIPSSVFFKNKIKVCVFQTFELRWPPRETTPDPMTLWPPDPLTTVLLHLIAEAILVLNERGHVAAYVIWPAAIFYALGLPLKVTVCWDMGLSNIAHLSTKPHGVISQGIVIFVPTIGSISHLIFLLIFRVFLAFVCVSWETYLNMRGKEFQEGWGEETG